MTDKCDCPSNVTDNLPRDAAGKVIPFGTKRLYSWKKDAEHIEVIGYFHSTVTGTWNFVMPDGRQMRCDGYYLDPPDSWERLLGDLSRAAYDGTNPKACVYVGHRGGCDKCRFDNRGRLSLCFNAMLADIARRICALRKEDANAD